VASKDAIQVEGTVTEPPPNATFNNELANGHDVHTRISGKIRMNFIKPSPAIASSSKLPPADLGRGHTIYRVSSPAHPAWPPTGEP